MAITNGTSSQLLADDSPRFWWRQGRVERLLFATGFGSPVAQSLQSLGGLCQGIAQRLSETGSRDELQQSVLVAALRGWKAIPAGSLI